jgi:acylphosphatase
MKCKEITVSGDVKNKGYRFAAMQKAYQLGVRGTVKKNRDGTIFIEAEGDDANLESFISWCNVGPLGAKVEQLDINEVPVKNFKGFDMI